MANALWENPLFEELTQGILRPGNLSLTKKYYDILHKNTHDFLLDIGSGTGITSKFLRDEYNFCVVSIDNSFTQAEKSSAKNPLTACAAMENLPFKENTFSFINCDCVLSLSSNKEKTIKEFAHILKDDGYLILSDLYLKDDFSIRNNFGRNNFTDDDLANYSQTNNHMSKNDAVAIKNSKDLSCNMLDKNMDLEQNTLTSTSTCATNALSLENIQEILNRNNFELISFHEHTKELKELTAKLIFAGHTFSCSAGSDSATASSCSTDSSTQIPAKVSQASLKSSASTVKLDENKTSNANKKLGYFYLIVQKRKDRC